MPVYNGSTWRIAQAVGTVTAPGTPQNGDRSSVPPRLSPDNWNPDRADGQCKDLFGPSYFFSVPTSAEEDAALGTIMARDIDVSLRRTWLYFYSNTEDIPLDKNYWLGNRTQYTNWFTNNPNNGGTRGVADCTLMNRDTGTWEDADCEEQHPFACFESGDWVVTQDRGAWREGYAACDKGAGVQSLFAVARDATENAEIQAALQAVSSAPGNTAAEYAQVWMNRTDLAFEEFFISNQTRRAWWAAGQPTNRNNSDCTVIDHEGNWIAQSCDLNQTFHACYLSGTGAGAQWALTKDLPGEDGIATWEYGFGYCKRFPGQAGAFAPPASAQSNTVLANMLSEGEFAWVNFSDQDTEGFWRPETPYQDFVSFDNVVEGDNKDCGYFSLDTVNEGNWLSGQCFAGGDDRGFACTNGYEWKIATQRRSDNASLTSQLWKDGFTACEQAFGPDYFYAAPASGQQNARLSLALSLSGNKEVWININDAITEGTWVANGPIVNLSPVLTLPSNLTFSEKVQIPLTVSGVDPESEGALTYQWSIIDTRLGRDGTVPNIIPTPVLTGANTNSVTISAVDLLNDPYFIDIQLQVTDAAVTPATTTTVLTVEVLPPLQAGYNFNTYTNPRLDFTGNNHELTLNVSQVGIDTHINEPDNFYARLDAGDSFTLDGSASGVQVGAGNDSYTVAFRFLIDAQPSAAFAGILQKGAAGIRQPGIFYDRNRGEIHYTNSTTSSFNENRNSQEVLRLGQWVNAAYVKNQGTVSMYIDKAVLDLTEPDPAPLQVVPDSTFSLTGTSIGFDNGNWTFGNVPGASESITGGIDDIRIYNRALTSSELDSIFVAQPKGRFEFVQATISGNEDAVDGGIVELDIPVTRVEGDDGIVTVGYQLHSGSAILNTDFRLKDDSAANPGTGPGSGTLTWQVHDRADKMITVELLGDSLREGTESFYIELEQLPTEPGIAERNRIDVSIVDQTPNPYGAVAFATTNGPVSEGASGVITVERAGSDTLGTIDVSYRVNQLSAIHGAAEDFTITQPGFVLDANPGDSLVGTGTLQFTGNASGTPVTLQTQTISFDTRVDTEAEIDELFSVVLTGISGTPVGGIPGNIAILGTNLSQVQVIQDVTPGRVAFVSDTYGPIEEKAVPPANSVQVQLERLGGSDGSLCVNLTTGGSAQGADYTLSYLNPSAPGQNNVFWADGDASTKTVLVTAVDDNIYDPGDNQLVLGFAYDAGCSSTTASLAEPGDLTSATVSITDQTDPAVLSFTQSTYSVSELTNSLSVTIQNTGNTNNAFQVLLTRGGDAVEGGSAPDYNLITPEVITFNPGDASKTVQLGIVDNCKAASVLTIELGLDRNNAVLNNSAFDADLIDISSGNSDVEIQNGSLPIAFTGIQDDFAGIAQPANWAGDGNYYVTSQISAGARQPLATQMALRADANHICQQNLTYSWSNAPTVNPALPTTSGTGFSISPQLNTVPGDQKALSPFILPFVVDNTTMTIGLTITDSEIGAVYNASVPGFANMTATRTIRQFWRRMENNNENQCARLEGGGSRRIVDPTCDGSANNFLAYNPSTNQLVLQARIGGQISCIQAGNPLTFQDCNNNANQKWRINNQDDVGVTLLNSNQKWCEEEPAFATRFLSSKDDCRFGGRVRF